MTAQPDFEIGSTRTGFRIVRTAMVVLGIGLSATAAADWQFDPILRLAWDYDDNATLAHRTDEEITLNGGIAEASLALQSVGESSNFFLRPMLRSRRYDSELDRDADDQFLDLRAAWRGERNQLRITGSYDREAVRTAEVADADLDTTIDPDEIPDDETGNSVADARRERIRAIPRWIYRFSNVASFETDLTFLDVSYDEQAITTLFDYTDARLRLTYRHNLSPRTSGHVTVSGRDYQTDRLGGDRTGYGIAAGINHSLSETVFFRASVGIEETDREVQLPNDSEDQNFVADVSLVRNLQTIRLLAQFRQRVSPSGRGQLSRRDEFNLRFLRDLNDRFSAGIGVRAYNVDSLDGLTNEQSYVQLRGQVIWRLSRTFQMQADYRYTLLDRELIGEGANSNRITLWFSWQPNPRGQGTAAVIR